MQYLHNINLDTIIVVYAGVKHTTFVLSDFGLINYTNGAKAEPPKILGLIYLKDILNQLNSHRRHF